MNEDENEVRIRAYCSECEEKITDEAEECYFNDEGEYFCSIECIFEHYGIYKLEG